MRRNVRISTAVVVTKFECPHCGMTMLRDAENCSTLHALPVCSQWLRHCEQTGAKFEGMRNVRMPKATN